MRTKVDCQGCRNAEPLLFAFTMAYHRIVDVQNKVVWGYEALVRGAEGQPAGQILKPG